MEIERILPFVLIPSLLLIASLSEAATVVVVLFTGICALYVHFKKHHRNRFSYYWTLATIIYMYLVFEMGIIMLNKITPTENIVFLIFLSSTWYCLNKMKEQWKLLKEAKQNDCSIETSSELDYNQKGIVEIYFRSVWWDCYIFRENYKHYLCGHVLAFLTLVYALHLGLTSVCRPYMMFGLVLMTHDCNDVYLDVFVAVCFVTCVYGVVYTIVVSVVLIQELLINNYLPMYMDSTSTITV
ncbi:uncharacterized protein LOC126971820 [Leptidea sinapis]|uniref:uncharacterized protein LOC126971820 n=1 Tax=Leptidea sinapis TaxID=189913 RepID=UPI0021471B24|nr:uncharacterized protein LOC126971820 [Leptidea sinapis]